jgi:hypothetical protein
MARIFGYFFFEALFRDTSFRDACCFMISS